MFPVAPPPHAPQHTETVCNSLHILTPSHPPTEPQRELPARNTRAHVRLLSLSVYEGAAPSKTLIVVPAELLATNPEL